MFFDNGFPGLVIGRNELTLDLFADEVFDELRFLNTGLPWETPGLKAHFSLFGDLHDDLLHLGLRLKMDKF